MNCPRCFSINTRKCSIVYEEGTSSGASWHFAQTTLARRCSPPAKPGIGSFWTLFRLGVSAWAAFKGGAEFEWGWWVVAGVFCISWAVCGLILSFLFAKRQKAMYDELYAVWLRSWVCLKCGEGFVSEDDDDSTTDHPPGESFN